MITRSQKLRNSRGASPTVQLVVTCAKAKRGPVPQHLSLRSVRKGTATDAAEAWVRRLADARGEVIPANDLYRGDHWLAASEAGAIATASGGRAWVCSAGYGLIPFDARIRPYS